MPFEDATRRVLKLASEIPLFPPADDVADFVALMWAKAGERGRKERVVPLVLVSMTTDDKGQLAVTWSNLVEGRAEAIGFLRDAANGLEQLPPEEPPRAA